MKFKDLYDRFKEFDNSYECFFNNDEDKYFEYCEESGQYYDHDSQKYFSYWLRENDKNLINPKVLTVSDLDFIIFNPVNNKILFLDHKCHNIKNLKYGQEKIMRMFDNIFRTQIECEYLGFYILTFSNNNWNDGYAYISMPFNSNFKPMNITESGFITFLNNI
jgi:hypothetical protein